MKKANFFILLFCLMVIVTSCSSTQKYSSQEDVSSDFQIEELFSGDLNTFTNCRLLALFPTTLSNKDLILQIEQNEQITYTLPLQNPSGVAPNPFYNILDYTIVDYNQDQFSDIIIISTYLYNFTSYDIEQADSYTQTFIYSGNSDGFVLETNLMEEISQEMYKDTDESTGDFFDVKTVLEYLK